MRPAIKAGRPDAAVRQLEPSKSDRLGSGSGEQSTAGCLLRQYRSARDRLDSSTELLTRGLDLIELLHWGVLDLDDARGAVEEFKRAVALHKRRRARS